MTGVQTCALPIYRDRLFWIVLSRIWEGWRESLTIVQPETIVRWHLSLLFIPSSAKSTVVRVFNERDVTAERVVLHGIDESVRPPWRELRGVTSLPGAKAWP